VEILSTHNLFKEGELVAQKRTVILGVIGADVHAVANKILDLTFSQAGFKVVNLGVMVSQEEFIDAAVESDAGAILVSSLYGHGEMDCRGLREKCVEAGIGEILLYAGGNLVVGKRTFDEVELLFISMGYSRVYPPGTMPEVAIADLQQDLGLGEAPCGEEYHVAGE
jgi:methylaspartate mutase sigma subunit